MTRRYSVAWCFLASAYALFGGFSVNRAMSYAQIASSQTPPTFLVHGGADSIVPRENSEMFYKALKKVNFPTDGALSLEYEENEKNPVADVKECIAIAREAEAKALA